MLKGLIFDMDGTLTWTDPLHHQAYNKVLAEFDIHLTFEEYIERFGGRGSESFFKIILKEYHLETDLQECIQKKSQYFAQILKEIQVKTIDGIGEFLKQALGHNLKLIVASGASRENIEKILTNAGLFNYFLDYVSVQDVARSKPYPDVFLEALRRLDIQATECWVFEDAINGVKAAKAAGLYCVALETTTKRELLIEAGADMVIPDYKQINEKLLIFNQ